MVHIQSEGSDKNFKSNLKSAKEFCSKLTNETGKKQRNFHFFYYSNDWILCAQPTEKQITRKWIDKFENQYIRQDTKLRNHYFYLLLLSLKFKIPLSPFDQEPPNDDQLETLQIGKYSENKGQIYRENPCDGPELQTPKTMETCIDQLISLDNFALPNVGNEFIVAPLPHLSRFQAQKE